MKCLVFLKNKEKWFLFKIQTFWTFAIFTFTGNFPGSLRIDFGVINLIS